MPTWDQSRVGGVDNEDESLSALPVPPRRKAKSDLTRTVNRAASGIAGKNPLTAPEPSSTGSLRSPASGSPGAQIPLELNASHNRRERESDQKSGRSHVGWRLAQDCLLEVIMDRFRREMARSGAIECDLRDGQAEARLG